MQDAIRPTTTPEFRLWLALIVAKHTRRALTEERRRYWTRFFTSWVEDDPDPQPSNLDLMDDANGLRKQNLEL